MLRKRETTVKTTMTATMPIIDACGAMIFMPSETKKSVRKKSRRGRVLAVTWMLYGKAAMLRPATSAPISFESPIHPAAPATAAHQPMLRATTISGALAIAWKA